LASFVAAGRCWRCFCARVPGASAGSTASPIALSAPAPRPQCRCGGSTEAPAAPHPDHRSPARAAAPTTWQAQRSVPSHCDNGENPMTKFERSLRTTRRRHGQCCRIFRQGRAQTVRLNNWRPGGAIAAQPIR
jgi:hypothetical protein